MILFGMFGLDSRSESFHATVRNAASIPRFVLLYRFWIPSTSRRKLRRLSSRYEETAKVSTEGMSSKVQPSCLLRFFLR